MAANSGRSNKEIVGLLVADIRGFADIVKEEAGKMMAEVEQLQSSWNDTQYKNFVNYMTQLTDGLVSDTAILYECADIIEEREGNI